MKHIFAAPLCLLSLIVAFSFASNSSAAQAASAATATEKLAAAKVWRVALARDVYTDYQRFMGPRDPLTLRHFDGPHSRRDVVEVVLLQQALQRGGASRELKFLLSDSEERTLKTLINGNADVSGTSSWKAKTRGRESHLLASRALIPQGHFVAGLYFPEGHPALQELARQPENIHRYTAICSYSWQADRDTLKQLGSPVLLTENWKSMLHMLKKKRGDFVLAPFQPTDGMRLQAHGVTLLPVPGIKVGLSGSRHFLLWGQGAEARALQAALDRGLEILEKEGTIARAYRESGFDGVATRNWRLINR